MSTRIRLQRQGHKKRPFYYIVVADSRAPRDGRFIERVGSYNPLSAPATIDVNIDKTIDWLNKGAQPTKTVRSILSFTGVLYKKHLLRGVDKGAFSAEEAEKRFESWQLEHDSKVADKVRKHQQARDKAKEDYVAKIREEREAKSRAIAEKEAKESEAIAKAKAAEKAEAEAAEAPPAPFGDPVEAATEAVAEEKAPEAAPEAVAEEVAPEAAAEETTPEAAVEEAAPEAAAEETATEEAPEKETKA